jgi:hypothetical protein
MTTPRCLRHIAHARAGDKGNRSNVALFVYDPADYALLLAETAPERIKRDLGGLVQGAVTRHELPALHGVNLVMDAALEGGVNESLNLDGHGKSWNFLLLGLEIRSGD